MTRKCIVPKCKSGYESNKERVSLFHVPKDEELKKKWIDAIPNTSVRLKSTHLVCEKHFQEADVIRHFIHKDAAGKVIIKIPYKCARLVDGAVPSVFSNVEGCPNIIHGGGVHDDIECREPEQHSITSDMTTPNSDPDGNANKSMIIGNQTVVITHDYQTENGSGTFVDETKELLDDKSNQSLKHIFEEIFENPDSVVIPKGWLHYTSTFRKNWIAFSTFDVKRQSDNLQPMIQKSVLVSEDGSVHISAHGKTVFPSNLLPSIQAVETVKDLNMILTTLSRMTICSGLTILQSVHSVRSNLTYQDNFEIWRHKDCPVVCTRKQCIRCERLKKSLQRTNRRLMQKNTKPKRLKLGASNERVKENITAVRKIVRRKKAAYRRAKERIEKLQATTSEIQKKLRELNKES